jgi:hypothetical protein
MHSAGLNLTQGQGPIRRSGPWHSGAAACRCGLAHGDAGLVAHEHGARTKGSPCTSGVCGATAGGGFSDAM